MDLIFFASIGNILGSILNWCIGYFLTNVKDRKWFPINKSQLTRASSWFLKIWKMDIIFKLGSYNWRSTYNNCWYFSRSNSHIYINSFFG